MRSRRSLVCLLACTLLVVAGEVRAQSGRLEYEMRRAAPRPLAQVDEAAPKPAVGLSGETLDRVRHGLFSLVLPGWSQYRAGHRTRAILFASAEVAIWGTWIFSEAQGNYRKDRYRDFAENFAGVGSRDHGDDYWRAVGLYRSSEDYNEIIRRDNRVAREEQEAAGGPVTIGLDDGTVGGSDAWFWTSERRFDEYGRLRSDSLSAFDRADLVIVFAIVNRVIAFADAVRSGPRVDDEDGLSLLEAKGLRLAVDVEGSVRRPSASLSVGRRF